MLCFIAINLQGFVCTLFWKTVSINPTPWLNKLSEGISSLFLLDDLPLGSSALIFHF